MNENWGKLAAIAAMWITRVAAGAAGAAADIAVWDQNPYAIATQEIQHLHCVMTLFEGTVVYEAN